MNSTAANSSSSRTRRREGRSALLPFPNTSTHFEQIQRSAIKTTANGPSLHHNSYQQPNGQRAQQQQQCSTIKSNSWRLCGLLWIWTRRLLTRAARDAQGGSLSYPKSMVFRLLAGLVVILSTLLFGIMIPSSFARSKASSVDDGFVVGRGIADLRSLEYQSKPRTMGYYFDGDITTESVLRGKPQRLYTYYERYPTKRLVHVSDRAVEAQGLLRKSRHYRRERAEPFETRECRAQYGWQLMSYPMCNTVHETDVNDLHAKTEVEERARIIASGFWRDTWMVRDFGGSRSALKTMRYEHGFEARNYDRHRRDALASERLTSSDNVVDIYAFCGNSGVFEFASGGDINDAIWPLEDQNSTLTNMDKLIIALQVSTALTDVHNTDKDGQASIAHTDITPSQFIMIDGKYKLNDFNRCRFIRWNRTDDKPCSYLVGRNPGKFRSPEEYSNIEQTEKVDVYSMGNIFYAILTEYWPFEGTEEKEAQEKIMNGERPQVDAELLKSKDSIDMALIEAMRMCWRQDPVTRASAKDVKQYLSSSVEANRDLK